jgi:hypothetical protein
MKAWSYRVRVKVADRASIRRSKQPCLFLLVYPDRRYSTCAQDEAGCGYAEDDISSSIPGRPQVDVKAIFRVSTIHELVTYQHTMSAPTRNFIRGLSIEDVQACIRLEAMDFEISLHSTSFTPCIGMFEWSTIISKAGLVIDRGSALA